MRTHAFLPLRRSGSASHDVIMRRLLFIGWFAGLSFLSPDAGWATVQTTAYVNAVTLITNGVGNRQVFFEMSPAGTVEVSPYAPDVVRVRFHFAGLYEREEVAIAKNFNQWPGFTQTFTQPSSTNYVIETSQLRVSITLSNRFAVHFERLDGQRLLEDDRIEFNLDYNPLTDSNGYDQVSWPGESISVSNLPSGFKLRAVKRMEAGDAFFGLGDTAGPLNRRGQAIQFWTQDTFQYGEGRTPKYTALPMLYGVRPPSTGGAARAYGLFFNNPARPVFKLYGDNSTWSFEAGDDQLDYFFFAGGSSNTMAAVADRFTELTGRPAMMPKWALGYHQSRHSYFTQDRVMEIASAIRSNDFPCDAIYLDIGTHQNFLGGSPSTNAAAQPGQFTFNASYTNMSALVGAVSNLGMRLVPLVEPLITTNDPLYGVALSNLYFIKNNDLTTYVGTNFLGRISWLDFSIVQTVDWWKGLMTNYLAAYGFTGIWNDLNEPNENAMPLDSIWYLDGRYGGGLVTNDSRKWHSVNKNTFSVLESRATYEALRTARPQLRPFVLSRSAWPGVQQYAAGWSGDNVSNFDHLRFSTPLGLSVMMSGQVWFGHDIGGFVGDVWDELLARWIQAGVLQPLFRIHSNNGTVDQEPWIFGPDFTSSNRRWIKFRYQMMPYLYSLAEAAATRGAPLNAPTAFYFYGDTNTYAANTYDYMAGPDVLVAPVHASGDSVRQVYLPAGESWYFWDTGRRYAGGQTVTVPASFAYLPLFTRGGAIIPRGPVQAYANEFVPDYLDILHWPGTNEFALYEDDGETTNYLAGVYARTVFEAQSASNALMFTIRARQGSYDPGSRDFYVIMHDADPVHDIRINTTSIDRAINREALAASASNGWSYSWYDRQLIVKVADSGAQQIIEADFTGTVPVAVGTYPSIYSNITVAGTFNIWNQKAANMQRIGTNRWAWVTDLSGFTNSLFKFVANGSWDNNWGDNNQSATFPPVTSQTADNFGNNISITGAFNGWITISFNDLSKNYSVVDARSSDIDSDGIPDADEARHGLNPYAAADAALDYDDDTFSNLDEYRAGTSIIHSSSYPRVTSIAELGFAPSIGWTAMSGRVYSVYASTNLVDAFAWEVLAPFTNVTGSGPVSITDTSAAPFKAYRIYTEYP